MDAPLRQVREIETEWVTMPDGCRLAARIFLPSDAERAPVPAILEFLPYRRRDYTRLRDDRQHAWMAARGYACIRVDMRGTGDSDGLTHGEYLQAELDDAVSIIEWVAAQPWCTGKLGMMGISWGGFNALQVAAMRPPALKAIITACSTDDRYADDIHWMGGCLIADNVNWSGTMFAFNSRPPDPEVVGDRWREMWLERLEALKPWILDWLPHQRRDAYWKHGSVCEDPAAIECAVYAVGGWEDGYSNAIPRMLERLSCPRKGLIGPWAHCWPHLGRPEPRIGFLREAQRWWDHWLKGVDTGIMDEPMLSAWMQDSVPPAPQYDARPGRWVAETAWPSSRIAAQQFALNRCGLEAEPKAEDPLTARTPQTLGLTSGEWLSFGDAGEMPVDQRTDDGQSLSFDTAALASRMEILGAPVVELEIAVDRPVAFLCARLCDVSPDGASTRVSYGFLNLTHDTTHETVTPLVPGARRRVRLQLNDIAHAFAPGHRIRLAVSTSYWPMVWPSPEPVTLTLFAGASRLLLPVRDAAGEPLPPAFAPPEESLAGPTEIRRPPARRRTAETEIVSGTVTVEDHKDRGDLWFGAIDLVMGGHSTDRYRLTGDDPLSAEQTCTNTITLARGAWQVRTETTTTLRATATDFVLAAEVRAYAGEEEVFARSWETQIPRDGN